MPEINWRALTTETAAKMDLWQQVPVVPTWSRLEPLPLTRGDLDPGAQALLADPLWLLGRQWQFDELRGEDAGSPVQVTIEGEIAPFTRFRPGPLGEGDATAGSVTMAADGPAAVPLEVLVEAERPPVLPVRLRTHLGLHLVRLLRDAGLESVAAAAAEAYGYRTPDPGDDPAGEARVRLVAGRVPDGTAVLADLAPLVDADGALTGLPDALASAAATDPAGVREVLAGWRTWADGLLAAPTSSSWNPHRLEYAFSTQATLSDGPVIARTDDYTGGTLDWFHGDVTASPTLGEPAIPTQPERFTDTMLPAPVRFAGMPNDRLFAFEDAAVYLGGVDAGHTDLARLALVEFAIAYGVDWFEVPLELRYGSATRIDRLQVLDTFGKIITVGPARESTRPGWAAFQSTPVTDTSRLNRVFVLAPTLPYVLEGAPLEEVILFRDEMANLAWGVERVVPGPVSGEPVQRAAQAARVSLRQAIPDDIGDAQIVYRLMTPVPENWIPLVAVRERPRDVTARHVLERRPMLRFLDDGTTQLIHPQGLVLLSDPTADPGTDRLQLAEEEVPRSGVVITRAFQLARTVGGGTTLWIGRRVRVGHGEGASGLRFDTALPPGGV